MELGNTHLGSRSAGRRIEPTPSAFFAALGSELGCADEVRATAQAGAAPRSRGVAEACVRHPDLDLPDGPSALAASMAGWCATSGRSPAAARVPKPLRPTRSALGNSGGPTRRLNLLTEAGFGHAHVAPDTGQDPILAARKAG